MFGIVHQLWSFRDIATGQSRLVRVIRHRQDRHLFDILPLATIGHTLRREVLVIVFHRGERRVMNLADAAVWQIETQSFEGSTPDTPSDSELWWRHEADAILAELARLGIEPTAAGQAASLSVETEA